MEAVSVVHRSLASSQFTFRLYEKEEGEGYMERKGWQKLLDLERDAAPPRKRSGEDDGMEWNGLMDGGNRLRKS